jgi:hypothetical protein
MLPKQEIGGFPAISLKKILSRFSSSRHSIELFDQANSKSG